jgi:hypothetical protein
MIKPMLLSFGKEMGDQMAESFDPLEYITVGKVRDEIDSLMTEKLKQLTPEVSGTSKSLSEQCACSYHPQDKNDRGKDVCVYCQLFCLLQIVKKLMEDVIRTHLSWLIVWGEFSLGQVSSVQSSFCFSCIWLYRFLCLSIPFLGQLKLFVANEACLQW